MSVMKECMLENSSCCSSGLSFSACSRLKFDDASERGSSDASSGREGGREGSGEVTAPPPPAAEGAEEETAKAFKNLTALPVTNPALARCSVVKSPMTSSSISCAGKNN